VQIGTSHKWMIFVATSGGKRVLRYHGQAYSPECVEGVFYEVRLNGVLRSSSSGPTLEAPWANRKTHSVGCTVERAAGRQRRTR
jgi:hypothetical protein